jgi:hypothetical protein
VVLQERYRSSDRQVCRVVGQHAAPSQNHRGRAALPSPLINKMDAIIKAHEPQLGESYCSIHDTLERFASLNQNLIKFITLITHHNP